MGQNHQHIFQMADAFLVSAQLRRAGWRMSGALFCTWEVPAWVSSLGRICVSEQKETKEAEVTSPMYIDCNMCVKCIAIWRCHSHVSKAISDSLPGSWAVCYELSLNSESWLVPLSSMISPFKMWVSGWHPITHPGISELQIFLF